MTTAQKLLLLMGQKFNPYLLPNTAARYGLDGAPSDSTYLLNSGNVALVADRSGNSAVNGLVLNKVVGNYAHFTALTAFGTGDFTVVVDFLFNSYDSVNYQAFLSSVNNGFGIGYGGSPSKLKTFKTTVAANTDGPPLSLFTRYTITYTRATTTCNYYTNGVFANTGTDSSNYTAGCSLLGQSDTSPASPLDGIVFAARVYSRALSAVEVAADYAGAIQTGNVLNINFGLSAKQLSNGAIALACTTGQTLTLNTTGNTGARICGARDLVQLTAAKQPAFSTGVDGRNLATFNGTTQYMQSAPFSLTQPTTSHLVGSIVTWAINKSIQDGVGNGNSLNIFADTTTPNISLYAGTIAAKNGTGTIGLRQIFSAVFSGASSSLMINRLTPTTGNPGTNIGMGYTIGASDTATNPANITFCEALLRSVADPASLRLQIVNYLIKKWGVTP